MTSVAQSLIKVGRSLRHPLGPRPLILMYHRVVELPSDPQLLAVRPAHFAQQLEILRRRFRVLRLTELADAHREGRLPRRSVVVTMDDGYGDNFVNAKPLLERYEVPATAFVTSDQIGQSREFWWDELERLVLWSRHLPDTVRLAIDGRVHRWDLGDAAEYTEDDRQRDRWWHVEQGNDPGPRHTLYRSLYQLLHPLPNDAKWEILEKIRSLAAAEPVGRPTHRALTVDELARLPERGLIDVGAHTRNHPALAGLPIDAQRDEILGSKARIEELVGRPITAFAYPHGSYSDQTTRLVREAGFRYACTSDPKPVFKDTNLLHLPRVVPRDWSAEAFEHWLGSWV